MIVASNKECPLFDSEIGLLAPRFALTVAEYLAFEKGMDVLFPPVDVLPSLSRLMQRGIGKEHTRDDHRKISDKLYTYYAMGRDRRKLETIVGREGMSEKDRTMLDFADAFEKEFVQQETARRNISETLDTGLSLLKRFSVEE